MKHLILIGFMGAGKTTVGNRFARELDWKMIDTDQRVVEKAGMPVTEIFSKYGEKRFREMETEVLTELLLESRPAVVSVGGGLPVQPQNAVYLKKMGTTVYLRAKEETLIGRLQGDKTRPLLQNGGLEKKIHALLNERAEIYEERADVVLDTDGLTLEQTVGTLLKILKPDFFH